MAAGSLRPIVCPLCGAALHRRGRSVACASGHPLSSRDGILDLAFDIPADSTAGFFDGPYGAFYDFGIKHPRGAAIAGRLIWGSDLGAMYRLMDRGARSPRGAVVLDVPVGGAPVLQRARRLECTYIGADLSVGMLEHAARVAAARGFDVTLIRADAARLPLRDRSVDRVLCFNGLHVIPGKAAVLAELARVLRPGGELWGSALAVPPGLAGRLLRPWTATPALFFHPAGTGELRDLARAAGFRRWNEARSGALLTFRART